MTRYSHYVRHIRLSLRNQGVSAEDLCSDLLTMPATNSDEDEDELALLSVRKCELEKAVTLNEIFNILVTNCASFLEYDIFVDTYEMDNGQEVLKYPEYLKAYLEKHKVSEFVKINPLLSTESDLSTELVLKINIELTVKMSKVTDLKKEVAKILGLNSHSLQLVDIKEGCVAAKFHIPMPVAEFVYPPLSPQQYQQLADLGIISLECNGHLLIFAEETLESADRKAEL